MYIAKKSWHFLSKLYMYIVKQKCSFIIIADLYIKDYIFSGVEAREVFIKNRFDQNEHPIYLRNFLLMLRIIPH